MQGKPSGHSINAHLQRIASDLRMISDNESMPETIRTRLEAHANALYCIASGVPVNQRDKPTKAAQTVADVRDARRQTFAAKRDRERSQQRGDAPARTTTKPNLYRGY